jgi:hypothetical protein
MNLTLHQQIYCKRVSILVIILFTLCLFLASCGTSQITNTVVPEQIATATTSAPTTIPIPTATLTRAQWDATKIAILDATEHERQTRVASGTPFASTPIPLTQVMPVTTPPMGLSGGCADPSSTIIFSNCWNGKRNDEYIFAAALVKKSDPTQGILRVYTTTVGISQFGPVGWYTTPTRSGLIEIVDATNYQLTLRAEDNSIFYFDVLTRQWVTPDPTPAPSAIPSSLPPTP